MGEIDELDDVIAVVTNDDVNFEVVVVITVVTALVVVFNRVVVIVDRVVESVVEFVVLFAMINYSTIEKKVFTNLKQNRRFSKKLTSSKNSFSASKWSFVDFAK